MEDRAQNARRTGAIMGMSIYVAIGIVAALLALPVGAAALMLLAGHARHRQRVERNRKVVRDD